MDDETLRNRFVELGLAIPGPELDMIMQLINQDREATEASVTKRIEYQAYQDAHAKMRDELERISHPGIKVLRRQGSLMIVEMLEDIKYGGDRIQVIISSPTNSEADHE